MSMTMPMPAAAPTPTAADTPPASASRQALPMAGVDAARSGWYQGMTTLSSQTIQAGTFKLLWICDVPGHWRGSEHQPLVLPSIVQKDGTTCDVMLAMTMSNDLYCFDHSAPDPVTGRGRCIWQQRLQRPGVTTTYYDMYMLDVPFWGGLSCPYYDAGTATLYVCCASSVDGKMTSIRYMLHAIDITDGSDKVPPLDISTAVLSYTNGGQTGTLHHDSTPRKQRAALGFFSYGGSHDVVFIADSTFAMMGNDAHGFIVGVDVTGLRSGMPMTLDITWCASLPPYAGAGIWQAGSGLIFDRDGNIFFTVANGAYDPAMGCFGNGKVKLGYTPPTATTPSSLTVLGAKAYYTDAGREGFDPTIPWIGLVKNLTDTYDGMDMTAKYDQDLGCAPPRYIAKEVSGFPDDLLIDCGKDGVAHGDLANALGVLQPASFAQASIQAEVYDTAQFITGATYFPGAFDITPVDLGKFDTTYDGYTRHQHSNPPMYLSPDHGLLVYYGGENGCVRVFQVTHTPGAAKPYAMTYLGTGLDAASPNEKPPGGMPGWFMTVSSIGNTKDTAALHCLGPLGNANGQICRGHYVIYGANWIAPTPQGGQLVKIFDSLDHPEIPPFDHCKFGHPSPALDKVAIPTYQAEIYVFG